MDRVMFNIVQVTHPVLLTTINSNINDVTLLFSQKEIDRLIFKHEQ
jgi:hypothetical protein